MRVDKEGRKEGLESSRDKNEGAYMRIVVGRVEKSPLLSNDPESKLDLGREKDKEKVRR